MPARTHARSAAATLLLQLHLVDLQDSAQHARRYCRCSNTPARRPRGSLHHAVVTSCCWLRRHARSAAAQLSPASCPALPALPCRTFCSSCANTRTFFRSMSNSSFSPGRCTLTTTFSPPTCRRGAFASALSHAASARGTASWGRHTYGVLNVNQTRSLVRTSQLPQQRPTFATWTWPSEAAAMGVGSNSSNISFSCTRRGRGEERQGGLPRTAPRELGSATRPSHEHPKGPHPGAAACHHCHCCVMLLSPAAAAPTGLPRLDSMMAIAVSLSNGGTLSWAQTGGQHAVVQGAQPVAAWHSPARLLQGWQSKAATRLLQGCCKAAHVAAAVNLCGPHTCSVSSSLMNSGLSTSTRVLNCCPILQAGRRGGSSSKRSVHVHARAAGTHVPPILAHAVASWRNPTALPPDCRPAPFPRPLLPCPALT